MLFRHPDSFTIDSGAYKTCRKFATFDAIKRRKTLALVLASRSAHATVVNDSQPNNRETSPSAKPHLCLPESWRLFFSNLPMDVMRPGQAFLLRRLSFAGIQVGENENGRRRERSVLAMHVDIHHMHCHLDLRPSIRCIYHATLTRSKQSTDHVGRSTHTSR